MLKDKIDILLIGRENLEDRKRYKRELDQIDLNMEIKLQELEEQVNILHSVLEREIK